MSPVDYHPMWRDLGLDLDRHDELLAGLGQLYNQVFLHQRRRPEGMKYFDFVMSEVHGLRIKELVDHRATGGKVVGSYCIFVPEELVYAVGAIPVGLCAGAQFTVPDAEAVLPANTCALIKSSYGFVLADLCPYSAVSDLIVGENTCDGKKKAYEIARGDLPLYVMDLPQQKSAAGRALLVSELHGLKRKLEEVTGNEITAEKLAEATRLFEAKRAALRRVAAARRASPPPISGLDGLLVNQVLFYDDVVRFTASANQLADELEQRVVEGDGVCDMSAPRVVLAGCPMSPPNWKVPHLIESLGGVVVAEELCTGSRYYSYTVPGNDGTVDGQIEALADRLLQVNCACFTPNDERVEDVVRLAEEYRAAGVVHYNLQFCHPYANEAVKVEKALADRDIRVLRVQTDYSENDTGQLKTRLEAFLEMLS